MTLGDYARDLGKLKGLDQEDIDVIIGKIDSSNIIDRDNLREGSWSSSIDYALKQIDQWIAEMLKAKIGKDDSR